MGLKGQPLLIQFINTACGTISLVRTVASARKHHQHTDEELHTRRLQTVNESSNIHHHFTYAARHISQYVSCPADTKDNAPRPWGMQPNTSFHLRMCISPLMFRLNIIPFPSYGERLIIPRNQPSSTHNPLRPVSISPHHPQTSPITTASKLRPYVATMFKNMRRLGDIGNFTNVKMLKLTS